MYLTTGSRVEALYFAGWLRARKKAKYFGSIGLARVSQQPNRKIQGL
jgi:hypothetical protein